jgi:GT2 family glycosyltransferase
MIQARQFESLGGWSDSFWMYMEDVDLCRRAHRAGLRVAFTPEAAFVHAHGGASRRSEESSTLTRTEAAISKHVYVSRHFRGAAAVWMHAALAARRLAVLALASLLDLLTLRTLPDVRTRTGVLRSVAAYYVRAWRRRSWLSERAVGSDRDV